MTAPLTLSCACSRRRAVGFTLVEVLVSMAILLIMLGIGLSLLSQSTTIWQRSVQQVQAFQSARLGFDNLTRDLGQATMNTYVEYLDNQAAPGPYFESESSYNGLPARYARRSDLHFMIAYPGSTLGSQATGPVPGTASCGTAVFFQAPLGFTAPVPSSGTTTTANTVVSDTYSGLNGLLNSVGYYVYFGPDATIPTHVTSLKTGVHQGYRYRLKQLLIPSDRDAVFPQYTNPYSPSGFGKFLSYDPNNPGRWFTDNTATASLSNLTRPNPNGGTPISNENDIADNVLVLSVRLVDPASPGVVQNTPSTTTCSVSIGGTNTYYYDSHYNERTLSSGIQPPTADQIPPVIQIAMIAIDERTALQMDNATSQPTALAALLAATNSSTGTARFVDQTNYTSDIQDLEKGLQNLRVNYRVFATSVPIRESRWTK